MPNPCDEAFEILSNYNNNCRSDIFFAMSHGVHRGSLKTGKIDQRENFIKKLIRMNKNIIFDLYGMNYTQPIWGDQFVNEISNSKMGLNLSRGAPIKHYSSDRLAQLIGNGLLTFIDKKTEFNKIFNDNEVILYNTVGDLSDKINFFKKNEKLRIKIAKNGQKKYFKLFNEKKISKYIVEKSFGNNAKLF